MFVNFECGECQSSMKIDLETFMHRKSKANQSMLSVQPKITCMACGSRFPEDVTYYLYEMLRTYNSSESNWKFAFEIKPKDARTSTDTP